MYKENFSTPALVLNTVENDSPWSVVYCTFLRFLNVLCLFPLHSFFRHLYCEERPELDFDWGGTQFSKREYLNTLHKVCRKNGEVYRNREEMMRVIKWLLVDREMDMYTYSKARPADKDGKGAIPARTAVHMLGNHTCIEVVQVFLDHGFDLTKGLDERGSSILHSVICKLNMNVVKPKFLSVTDAFEMKIFRFYIEIIIF